METRRFYYRLRAGRIVPMLLVALAIPVITGYSAMSARSEVTIVGIVLSPSQASGLFWIIAALSLPVAVLAIWMAWRNSAAPGFVELGPTDLSAPTASLSMAQTSIPYRAISRIGIDMIPGDQMIVIESKAGNVKLLSSGFLSPLECSSFLRQLTERSRLAAAA